MVPTILLLGTLDSKGREYRFLKEKIESLGAKTCVLDMGARGTPQEIEPEISSKEVAQAGGVQIAELIDRDDRAFALKVMAEGATKLVRELYQQQKFEGMIGMGGSGGTSAITSVMQSLPYGIPKMCVTTVASGDTSNYVGIKDVILIPSIVDVAGLNSILCEVLTQAAGAITGMVNAASSTGTKKRAIIAATMFGNTTQCVDACRQSFEAKGYEVLVFHATGTGGRTMESLIAQGKIDAVMDITTTELADELCGGVFSAGESRLTAAAQQGIPQLIVPGCIDMVNFGPAHSVPKKYIENQRKLVAWNTSVTLMRTNIEENQQLGKTIALRANLSTAPVAICLPLRGVSLLDGDGGEFCDREANAACFDAIRENLREDIPLFEVDANINDPAFSNEAIRIMESLINQHRGVRAI